MEQVFDSLSNASPDELIPFLAMILLFGGGIVIAVVAIVFRSITAMVRSKETERSRREIAAYIAEGSMSPEEGERLLRANGGRKA